MWKAIRAQERPLIPPEVKTLPKAPMRDTRLRLQQSRTEIPVLDDTPEDQRRTLSRAHRRLFAPGGTAARRRSVTGWRATIIRGLGGERSLPGQRARIGHCRRVRVRQARGAGDGAAATARRSGVAGVP